MATQKDWFRCSQCQGLYFVDVSPGSSGVCPLDHMAHVHTGSWNYTLEHDVLFTSRQKNWRWCHKCQGLYFAGSLTQGVCPAGGSHDHTGSGNYALIVNTAAAPGQESNWRWCKKCLGLYFSGGMNQGVCPAAGLHDHTGSGNYTLDHK